MAHRAVTVTGDLMTSVWVQEAKSDLAWTELEELGQGGQGVTRKVQHKESNAIGCLKLLSKQKDEERRLRFFREATAYDTCQHHLIPRLLSSNAHNHADLGYKLFLVTEYVPGPTVSERIEEKGPLTFDDGLKLTIELLKTVAYIHGNDWVHRDIKSDNIILRDGEISAPVLLDFGLSFKEGVADTLKTEHDQEIGNRFLRLPDLSIGSSSKRDERSDLAFVGGILFYVLTGLLPATLQDASGSMPHQRKDALAQLSVVAGSEIPRLLDFFDRCFNPVITRRHDSASSMLASLETILRRDLDSVPEDDLAFIKSHLARDSVVEVKQLGANCQAVYRAIDQVVNSILTELGGQFVHSQGGMQQRGASVHANLGVAQSDNHEIRFSPRWEIDVQGSEIVVRSSSDYLYRLDALKPDMGAAFSDSLRLHILKGIRGLIEAPARQVVYRGFFKATPFPSLSEALVEARRTDRKVFAVIFDEKHRRLSDLDYVLGAFMRHEETKELVHANFAVAIVPLSDAQHVVATEVLEVARLYLLDQDGTVLYQRDVYANADEGLRIVTGLIAM